MRRLPIKYANIASRGYPTYWLLGDREKETKQVSVRNQKGEDLGSMALDALLKNLNKEISDKS